jgi:hypothetical protein
MKSALATSETECEAAIAEVWAFFSPDLSLRQFVGTQYPF